MLEVPFQDGTGGAPGLEGSFTTTSSTSEDEGLKEPMKAVAGPQLEKGASGELGFAVATGAEDDEALGQAEALVGAALAPIPVSAQESELEVGSKNIELVRQTSADTSYASIRTGSKESDGTGSKGSERTRSKESERTSSKVSERTSSKESERLSSKESGRTSGGKVPQPERAMAPSHDPAHAAPAQVPHRPSPKTQASPQARRTSPLRHGPLEVGRPAAVSPGASSVSLGLSVGRGASTASLPASVPHATEEAEEAAISEDSPTSWLRPQSPQATPVSTPPSGVSSPPPQEEETNVGGEIRIPGPVAAIELEGHPQQPAGEPGAAALQDISTKLASLQALVNKQQAPLNPGGRGRAFVQQPSRSQAGKAGEEPLLVATQLGLELVERSRQLEATVSELRTLTATHSWDPHASSGSLGAEAEQAREREAAALPPRPPSREATPPLEGARAPALDLESRLAVVQMEACELRQENARLRAEQGTILATGIEGSQDAAIRWMQNELDRERRAHAQQLEALARELQEQRQQLAIAVSRRMAVGGRISLGAASVDSRGPECCIGVGSITVQHMQSLGGASCYYSSVPPSPALESRVGWQAMPQGTNSCVHVQSNMGTPSTQIRAVTPTPGTPLAGVLGAVVRSQSMPVLQQSALNAPPQSRSRSRSSTPAGTPVMERRDMLPAPAPRSDPHVPLRAESSQPRLPSTWNILTNRSEPIAANVPRVAAAPTGWIAGMQCPLRSASDGTLLGAGEVPRKLPPVPVCVMQSASPNLRAAAPAPARRDALSPPPAPYEPVMPPQASAWSRPPGNTLVAQAPASYVAAAPSPTWVAPTASPMRPAIQVARGAKVSLPASAWCRPLSPPRTVTNLAAAFGALAP